MLRTSSRGPITRIHLARTAFGRPLRTVEAYFVDGLLIESGPPATASEIVRWCRGKDVRQVVNTHHHEDHAGGDSALQRALALPVAAPAKAVPTLKHPPRLHFYRRLVWGQLRRAEAEALRDIVATRRYRLEVIPTPGHSHDHVCLFEPEQGWLFSGDLFIHERARYLRADEDAHEILNSLRRVVALRPRLLICSHAGFVEDPCAAIERKIAYWDRLTERAQVLRRDGLSLRAVTDRLLGREGIASVVSQGHFSKINLIRSLLR